MLVEIHSRYSKHVQNERLQTYEYSISIGVKLGKGEDSEKVNYSIYRRLSGSLLYLTANRPNIPFVKSFLSRFMHSPKHIYFTKANDC